jgi:glycosyltransferase involved in cell wall biosynthesis
MSFLRRVGEHLPRSVTRTLQGARAVVAVEEPLQASKALGGLSPRRRRAVGRAMMAVSRVSLPRSRRSGRAALLDGLGHAAVGDRERSAEILRRVAEDPATSDTTRVEIGRLLLQANDIEGARAVLERMTAQEHDRNASRHALQARVDLALARYPEALQAARAAVFADPRRAGAQALVAQAQAELRARDAAWRPTVAAPSRPHQPRPGHIAMVVGESLPRRQSGNSIRTQSVAAALGEVGLDVVVASRRQEEMIDGGLPVEAWQVSGVRYRSSSTALEVPERPDHNATLNAAGIATIVEEHGAAVLHPVTPWPDLLASLAVAERYRIPVVYEVRGFREESRLGRQAELAGISAHDEVEADTEIELMRAADALVTVSEAMRDHLTGRGIPAERITVVPHGVDTERFRPIDRDDALARQMRLGDGPVIGSVTTLAPSEDIDTLVRATAELRRRGRGVRCLIVGDGIERDRLLELRRRTGTDDGSVVFAGRVAYADVNAYYSLLDVFVVPRRQVGVAQLVTPLKPYEAMAMERAVVVSRVEALAGMIAEGETGLSFTPEDPIDLADVLEPLLFDQERRETLGRTAGAWVREHRTWRRSAERYLELYRTLGVA